MVVAKLPKEPNEFGRRVQLAMREEGHRSQNDVERKAGIPKGYLSRMIYGTRGETSVNVEYMKNLCSVLHVNFEWLVIGTGPMRRDGRETTPAEQAITTARTMGSREDAITTAWERNRDREAEMTASDWLDAIDAEAKKLERAGVPRPEAIASKQEAIQREKKKLERAKETKKLVEGAPIEEVPAPARRRLSGGV